MKLFFEEIKKNKNTSAKKPNDNDLPDHVAAIGLLSIAAILVFGVWWLFTLDLIPSIGTSVSLITFTWALDATWKWKDKR